MGDDRIVSPRIHTHSVESEADRTPNRPSASFFYRDIFDKECGYYLSIGMSYDDYWNGDCAMVKYYRDKAQYELEEKNRVLWLQGMYLYETLLRLSPALKPFVKNPTPERYMEEPYPISIKTDEEKKKAKEEQQMQNGLNFFTALATNINQQFNADETHIEVIEEEGGDDSCGT